MKLLICNRCKQEAKWVEAGNSKLFFQMCLSCDKKIPIWKSEAWYLKNFKTVEVERVGVNNG